MRKLFGLVLVAAMAFTMPLMGGGKTEEPERPATVSKWTGPRFGGELNFAMKAAPPTADTPTTTAASSQYLGLHVNETLVGMSEDYKVVPLLAESWEISPDKKTYTFALRRGIKFHNGQEVTSEDVVASFDRFRKVSVRSAAFDLVASCTAKDRYTVVFELSKPSRVFLFNLAYTYADMCIQPKSVIEGKGAGALRAPDEIIGTGPYRLISYEPDRLLVLERFEDYQPLPGERDGAAGGKVPYFDRINIHVVPEATSRIAGLETGMYDVLEDLDPANYIMFRDGNYPNIEVFTIYPGNSPVMMFNHREKFSGDVVFRQAVLAALDMEEIALFASAGQKDFFRLGPYLWPKEGARYMPNDPVAEAHYNQNNVAKAKELLAQAGYRGEQIIMACTRDHDDMYAWAVSITDQLKKKLGMNVRMDVYDWPALNAKWEQPGWHFSTSWFGSYNFFPMVVQTYWDSRVVSAFRAGYSNPAVDAVFDRVVASTTQEEENQAWRELQRVFWEDLPSLKLYERPSFAARRAELKNYVGWYRHRFYGVWKD